MEIPPGIVYLTKKIPRIFIPLSTLYAVHRIRESYFDLELPEWVVLTSYLVCLPATFTCVVLYKKYRNNRIAASLGAIVPPTSGDDPTPGGLYTLFRAVRNFKSEYPGKSGARF